MAGGLWAHALAAAAAVAAASGSRCPAGEYSPRLPGWDRPPRDFCGPPEDEEIVSLGVRKSSLRVYLEGEGGDDGGAGDADLKQLACGGLGNQAGHFLYRSLPVGATLELRITNFTWRPLNSLWDGGAVDMAYQTSFGRCPGKVVACTDTRSSGTRGGGGALRETPPAQTQQGVRFPAHRWRNDQMAPASVFFSANLFETRSNAEFTLHWHVLEGGAAAAVAAAGSTPGAAAGQAAGQRGACRPCPVGRYDAAAAVAASSHNGTVRTKRPKAWMRRGLDSTASVGGGGGGGDAGGGSAGRRDVAGGQRGNSAARIGNLAGSMGADDGALGSDGGWCNVCPHALRMTTMRTGAASAQHCVCAPGYQLNPFVRVDWEAAGWRAQEAGGLPAEAWGDLLAGGGGDGGREAQGAGEPEIGLVQADPSSPCMPCGLGAYKSDPGWEECTPCPTGQSTMVAFARGPGACLVVQTNFLPPEGGGNTPITNRDYDEAAGGWQPVADGDASEDDEAAAAAAAESRRGNRRKLGMAMMIGAAALMFVGVPALVVWQRRALVRKEREGAAALVFELQATTACMGPDPAYVAN
eukprot:SAG22_NODE_51_length_24458_cov_19.853161_8_plen_581_part_00